MTKTSSEHYYFIFSNIDQNNNIEIGSGFPPTSGQIPPTSCCSNWPKLDPHMAYTLQV